MGGGLASLGDLVLTDSLIQDNWTSPGGNGGGIYLGASESGIPEPLIQNTKVISNTSSANGGGLYAAGSNIQLDNLLVAGNRVDSWQLGNGLFLADHDAQINHLTLAGNAPGYGSGIFVLSATAAITNSIVAGQHTGIFVDEGASVTMESTLWGADAWANTQDYVSNGALITGTHNLHADPLFFDPAAMDFHLTDSSPAVDAGVETGLVVDIDNQIRPNPSTGLPDIGADEVWAGVIPVASVQIEATAPITATLPATLTASIQPLDATPMVSYLWFPSPIIRSGDCRSNLRLRSERSTGCDGLGDQRRGSGQRHAVDRRPAAHSILLFSMDQHPINGTKFPLPLVTSLTVPKCRFSDCAVRAPRVRIQLQSA